MKAEIEVTRGYANDVTYDADELTQQKSHKRARYGGFCHMKNSKHLCRIIGEFFAKGFVTFATLVLAVATRNQSPYEAFVVNLLGNWAAYAIAIYVGHPYGVFRLNPLNTFIDNRIPWVWKLFYILAQILAAILFGGLAKFFVGSAGCMAIPVPSGSYWKAFWIEFIGTIVPIVVIVFLSYNKKTKFNFCFVFPIASALCIAGSMPFSGASLDIARHFASMVWAWGCWTHAKGLYFIVPAVIAVLHVIFTLLRTYVRGEVRKGQ